MFTLEFSAAFQKTVKKKIKPNQQLYKSLKKTVSFLRTNPFHNSLKSHKVDTKRNKDIYSSTVTGDWRIGWEFDEEIQVATILCLEIGTHSGSDQIYKNKS
jgi:mRNA-degrading endonuclease YafQ of YafQ-DinJ toxin-antitoxin module